MDLGLSKNTEMHLIKEAHEAKLLKAFLADKLACYVGIKHDELETVCAMFGISKKGESK